MVTFVSAYSIVLLAVVAYVARMGVHQRRLSQAVEMLENRTAEADSDKTGFSRAA